ncbi:MAG TPA: FAD-dependent monooxygenase [Gaiellaceae bacterium]|nr:FAD-dependent monooxygenase [Gaiellaceae bacterium]
MADTDVPVLVVGGSLVGLSTALFLADNGISPVVVERHPGPAIHPRAALFFQRTVELWRSVDLENEIVTASSLEFEQNGAVMSVESLGGDEVEWFFRHINEGVEELSPSPRLFVTQIGLEPILRRRAEELGAEVRYSWQTVSVQEDDDGVTATVRHRESGEEQAIHARYLVAADGAHSPIRDRLGIPMRGHGSFSNSITIYFRGDVKPLLRERNLSVIYVFNPRLQGFFRFSKAGDAGFLVVNKAIDEHGELSADIWGDTGENKCVEFVREALGDPEIEVEIENVQRWNASAEWAERFQQDRIFLAGDSAHVMPPTGGYGGNVGVQDAHNLAWKLACVVKGEAGPGLLASYDDERRPIAEETVEQAYARYVLRLAPELGKENLHPMVDDAAIDLGYRYHSGAVATDDGNDGLFVDPREPAALPGVRAPHVTVEGGSTLDLFGRSFVLLTGDERWQSAADGLDLQAHLIRSPGFTDIYGTGAVIVRPDGFVGWRTDDEATDGTLQGVLDRLLAR